MSAAQASQDAPPTAAVELSAEEEGRLKALYSVMQSIENKLGGGEGVEGLYGSIKKSGMDKVVGCMRQQCGLDARSVLVDVGAGLGRPLMHALLCPGIAGARGIEIDRVKCDKAAAFLRQAVAELVKRGKVQAGQLELPQIDCSPIEEIRSLDPCTHAYSFWEGVPIDGKAGFGRLFAASRTLRSVAVVQRAIRTCPLAYMEDLGFGELVLVGSFSVSMSGSGRSFTAYVFNKAVLPAPLPAPLAVEAAGALSVLTPAQAADAAAAALSLGTGAAFDELEKETAQSRLAAPASPAVAPAEAATWGRGRRQPKPSVKRVEDEETLQTAAAAAPAAAAAGVEEDAGRMPAQPRSARQQRAERQASAVQEAARASAREQAGGVVQLNAQQAQQGKPQQEQRPQAAPVPALQVAPAAPAAVSALASPRRSARSMSRPAAAGAAVAKPTAPSAAKLSSPQRGGVQKRSSPIKAGAGAVGALASGVRRASPRKLALSGVPAAAGVKGAGAENLLPAVGTGGPLLQHAVRVTKAGAAGGPNPEQPAVRRVTRRGLNAA